MHSFKIILKAVMLSILCFSMVTMTVSFKPAFHDTNKGEEWIPEDFNPKDVILLIQDHPFGSKQNDRMIEFLDKEYKWRYEIVTLDQMRKNKKYEDKKVYKFALLWANFQSPEVTTSSHGFTYNDIDGHFLDRSADKEYSQSKLGRGFGQIGYRKVIKAINKKFKGEA